MPTRTTLILMLLALAWPHAPTQSAEPNPPAKRAPAAPIAYAKPGRLANLTNKKINESSGLACSRRRRNVFWTHNDSGDKPRIYAFNNKGKDLGTFDIAGAQAIDWEDMASVRLGKTPYLLLADVGDNNTRRKNCTLYFVKEPDLPAGRKPVQGKVKVARTIRFKYPDGPQNCEAVAIDPTTRTVYIIAKAATGICDDLLSTTLCTCWNKKVLIAPAMNTNMWNNPAVQKNVETIKAMGAKTIGPESGRLACGTEGIGRMAEPTQIIEAIEKLLG